MSTIIPFNDTNLIDAIKRELRVDHDLTQDDLLKLHKLRIYDDISDLTGIELAENLNTLSFNYGIKAKLQPLLQLKNLHNLKIKVNNLSDLELICQLTQLLELDLSNSIISSLQPISTLTNLIQLDLSNCNIYHIDILSQLDKLRHLCLKQNNISDISPIENLVSLQSLDVSKNQLSTINCIAKLTQLSSLTIDNNEITDISMLRSIPMLKGLSVSGNPISNIDVFQYLPNLVRISVVRINVAAPTRKAKELIKLAKENACHKKQGFKLKKLTDTISSCQFQLGEALKEFVAQRNGDIPYVSDVKQLFNQLNVSAQPEQYVLLRILEDGYVDTLKNIPKPNVDPFILSLYTSYAIDKILAKWAFQTWAHVYSNEVICSQFITPANTNKMAIETQDEKSLLSYVKHNDLMAVRQLNDKQLNYNYKYSGNKTLLSIAIENQFVDMVKILLEKGCNPDIPIIKGQTALMLAIQSRNTKIVNQILEYTTEINIQDARGYSALHYAVSYEMQCVVQKLISKNANLFIKTSERDTPFEMAIYKKNLEICKTLISSDPERFLQYKFHYDYHALNLAIRYNIYELCVYLIELSTMYDVEIINKTLSLYDACYYKNKKAAQLLLKHGADRSIKKFSDTTLLDYAMKNSTSEIVELLKS